MYKNKVSCEFCKSRNTIKRGRRKLKPFMSARGRGLNKQRYECKECKRRFTKKKSCSVDMFRMRKHKKVIEKFFEIIRYYEKRDIRLNSRELSREMTIRKRDGIHLITKKNKKYRSYKVSHETINRCLHKYYDNYFDDALYKGLKRRFYKKLKKNSIHLATTKA